MSPYNDLVLRNWVETILIKEFLLFDFFVEFTINNAYIVSIK